MRIDAQTLLASYGHPSLQQMARQRGLDPRGRNKAALVTLLAPKLAAPQAIQAALADLTPLERRLLDHVLLVGGDAPTERVRRLLEREGGLAPRSQPSTWSYYGQAKMSPG